IISDPRHLTHAVSDGLWVRILDLPNALQSRSYTVDGSVVIRVEDSFMSQLGGTFEINVRGGVATVDRSGASPQLTLDIADLGSLYLGHNRAEQLRRAGRIQGDTDAIATLDRIMSWPVRSWTQEIF
ncbi:MAG: sterol carrier protein domain-containing protein, partial [Acidimicrobiia bacterium]|nr:sterol carrier protein domain-containing protein [Acidimicrobiia bacterium]